MMQRNYEGLPPWTTLSAVVLQYKYNVSLLKSSSDGTAHQTVGRGRWVSSPISIILQLSISQDTVTSCLVLQWVTAHRIKGATWEKMITLRDE